MGRETGYCAQQDREPGGAQTPPSQMHRRSQLPCTDDLIAHLLALVKATMPAADRRHEQAAAFPAVEAWIIWLDLENKMERTLHSYERQVAPLLRSHPGKTVDQFTSADVIAELQRVPRASRHIPRSIYNSFFAWLHTHDWIDRNPMVKVPKISAQPRRHKDIFTSIEVARLEGLPMPDGQLFTILFGTGIRRTEARMLQRKHIDLNRGRLVVYDGKGGKDRVVPFPPTVTIAVSDLDLLERLSPDDHLWHRKRFLVGDPRRRHDPIGSTTFTNWWTAQLAAAGVDYKNPHQTRHTYHWLLRQGGLDLEDRQFLMGHASPETTVRQYGRNDLEAIAAKVAAL